jgi:probable HAF family extracellular repeat protein
LVLLGDVPDRHSYSIGFGINSQGQVAGMGWPAAAGTTQGFVWTPSTPNGTTGSMFDLGALPGGSGVSEAKGINASGQVTGFSNVVTNVSDHAFLWSPSTPNGAMGTMVDLGDLPDGDDFSQASAINDHGQVIGFGHAATGTRGFLWTPTVPNGSTGSMIDLGDLPGGNDNSFASAINSTGQIVGSSGLENVAHAFLWSPTSPNGTVGSMVDLHGSGDEGMASSAWGINSHGQIVGQDVSGAFLWTPEAPNATTGAFTNLNERLAPQSSAGWILEIAYGINDVGQIVGTGSFDPDGPGPEERVPRGFLLTLVPEPTGILIAVCGLMLLPWRRFGRK